MANKIVLKKSSVAAKIPLATDLDVGELAVNLVDQKLYSKKADGTVVLVGTGGAGSGDVAGPASATDNALTRFDGTTGKLVQNSSATLDDSGNLTANSLRASGTSANRMPVGTTAQRPAAPVSGEYRMNSTTGVPEWYNANASAWVPFSGYNQFSGWILTIGGGGGGAGDVGGGGGAGGYVEKTETPLNTGTTYELYIGAGGAAAIVSPSPGTYATVGGASKFGDISAIGGGRGGGTGGGGLDGGSGGSGGGGFGYGANPGGAGLFAQGNNGGSGAGVDSSIYGGGGGGGAGAAGQNGVFNQKAGDGGAGLSSSITGTATARAGGGGGGQGSAGTGQSLGGTGGGGRGSTDAITGSGGSANTGGGGGGGARSVSSRPNGFNGGSGVVIIRIPNTRTATFSAGLTATLSTAVSGFNIYTVTAGLGTVTFS